MTSNGLLTAPRMEQQFLRMQVTPLIILVSHESVLRPRPEVKIVFTKIRGTVLKAAVQFS
jgi:hypothetical protein